MTHDFSALVRAVRFACETKVIHWSFERARKRYRRMNEAREGKWTLDGKPVSFAEVMEHLDKLEADFLNPEKPSVTTAEWVGKTSPRSS